MKRWILLTIVILLACSLMNGALADGKEFTIVNASDANIYDLAIRPVDSDNLGPDVLAKGHALKPDKKLNVEFPNYDAGIEYWDIVGHDCCGEELVWHKVQLGTASTIILHDDGKVELN